MLFCILLALNLEATCITGKTNCLRCLDVKGCFYCFDDLTCHPTNATYICKNKETTRTRRCIEELGGDAKNSVRHAIGFSILIVSIIIDMIVRICNNRRRNEYARI